MSERMIKQFMEMVQIDSESGNEATFIQYLKGEFEKLDGIATGIPPFFEIRPE